MIEPARVAEVMGGLPVLGRRITSVHDMMEMLTQGLPKAALRHTVHRVFRQPREANTILYRVVPEATYKRRRHRLRANESERTERLARVIAAAEQVWDSAEDAHLWLRTPHPELDNRSPLECAFTELGARQVEELLDRIFYGLPV